MSSGVGYDVLVPLSTFYGCGDPGARDRAADPHARARGSARALWLCDRSRADDVREADRRQRHRAEAGARRCCPGIEPRDLAGAIQRNDIARLTAIPGVGKKTAERICVELRDRLPKTIDAVAGVAGAIRCVKISSRRSPISATIGRRSTRCSTSCPAARATRNSKTCCGRR